MTTTYNMGIRILIVGSTGHIGGAVLDELIKTSPDLYITAIVRSTQIAETLTTQYQYVPIQTTIATLEDEGIMEDLASDADIVINCAPDVTHDRGIKAILRGLASRNKPCFYIHTSGAALIWDKPTGDVEGRAWDDVADIDEILAQPDSATHAATDRIVRSADTQLLRTAIISPSFVTGVSPSQTHPTPLVFPDWLYVVASMGCGLVVSKGVNRLSFVEVKQLARLYVQLAEDAIQKLQATDDSSSESLVDSWGPRAYYFAASIELSVRDFMEGLLLPALKKHGAPYLQSTEIESVTIKTIQELVFERLGGVEGAEVWSSHIADAFGINMRVKGTRAEKALGLTWESGDAGIDEAVGMFLLNHVVAL